MLTILWLSLNLQKAENWVSRFFRSILGMNLRPSDHLIQIAVELKERCRVCGAVDINCGAVDINYETHTYVILFLHFHYISAAGRPQTCYQSIPCLTVNCFLLPREHGS